MVECKTVNPSTNKGKKKPQPGRNINNIQNSIIKGKMSGFIKHLAKKTN
jgi:hypothetical protein